MLKENGRWILELPGNIRMTTILGKRPRNDKEQERDKMRGSEERSPRDSSLGAVSPVNTK